MPYPFFTLPTLHLLSENLLARLVLGFTLWAQDAPPKFLWTKSQGSFSTAT